MTKWLDISVIKEILIFDLTVSVIFMISFQLVISPTMSPERERFEKIIEIRQEIIER